jgi:hypothetical protein
MSNRLTRSDAAIGSKLRELLDKKKTFNKDDSLTDRLKNRIDIVKEIFNILCTSAGKTFVHKHDCFKNVVVEKMSEFYKTIPELVIKWHREIFGTEFQIPVDAAEDIPEADTVEDIPEADTAEAVLEEKFYACACDQCLWIYSITKNAVLTRERFAFLREVWDILVDIDEELNEIDYDNTMNDYDYQHCNNELYEILCTDKGQLMLRTFPEFLYEMEEAAYSYSNNGAQQWEVWWHDVFGCEINDERYTNSQP